MEKNKQAAIPTDNISNIKNLEYLRLYKKKINERCLTPLKY